MAKPVVPRRAARRNVYDSRLTVLGSLPICFTLSELRGESGISADAAAQTCRRWVESQHVVKLERGFFRKSDRRPNYPERVHRALADGLDGFLTGMGAMAFHRVVPKWPEDLDVLVVGHRGTGPRWGEGRIRFHSRRGAVRSLLGVSEHRDAGRTLRVADPARAFLDCLFHPGVFLRVSEAAELLKTRKTKFRQSVLLDLTTKMESETIYRRLRVMAEYAEMASLSRWLEQHGGFRPRMGRILLDPHSTADASTPTRFGVRINVQLP